MEFVQPAGLDVRGRVTALLEEALRRVVGLGVDARVVEDVLRLRDTQEAGALFVRLRAEFRHLLELRAAGELAVLLTVRDDVLRDGPVDAGDVRQERGRRRVEVRADGVDTVLDDAVEGFSQLFLRHVVLVLADADRLRVDLDEFRERVLQTAADRDGGPDVDVEVRELFRRELRSGIDGRAGFGHDHVGDASAGLLFELADGLGGKDLGLFRGRAVADRDDVDVVFLQQFLDGVLRLRVLAVAVGDVDDRRVEDLAGAVDDRGLTAHAVAGVEREDDLVLDRRRHEERPQVLGEHLDGVLVGPVFQRRADLPLHARVDEPVVGVLRGGLDKLQRGGTAFFVVGRRGGGRRGRFGTGLFLFVDAPVLFLDLFVRVDERAVDDPQCVFLLEVHGDFEEPFLLSAVQREDAVVRHFGDGFRELVVLGIDTVFVFRRFGRDDALRLEGFLQRLADVRIVGDELRDDVRRALQRIVHRLDTLLGVDIRGRRLFECALFDLALPEVHRQRLQALLLRHHGAGAALLLVRAVQVFELGQHGGGVDLCLQFVREFALLLDGVQDLLAALVEVAQVREAVVQFTQDLVVQ